MSDADSGSSYRHRDIATIMGRGGESTHIAVEIIDGDTVITATRADGADPLELTPDAVLEAINALGRALVIALRA